MPPRSRRWRNCILMAVFAALLALPVAARGQPQNIDNELCGTCHDTVVQMFAATTHGRLREFEMSGGSSTGCIGCHGDGLAHMDAGGDPSLIRGLGSDTLSEEIGDVCSTCHRSAGLHDWPGSTHELNGVSCADCHNPHVPAARAGDSSIMCYTCHAEVQAQFEYPSHHPVREGAMTCSSCHLPHGGSINLLRNQERPAELCFECHTSKQGPFIFEHEPVMEGCSICHSPHGAVANNLLVQNEPFLCLQCHEFHFHAGLEGNNEPETYIPRYDPANDPADGVTYPGGMVPNPFQESGYKRAFTTKCTQCHTQVHGSDFPSQTVPGQGGALMR